MRRHRVFSWRWSAVGALAVVVAGWLLRDLPAVRILAAEAGHGPSARRLAQALDAAPAGGPQVRATRYWRIAAVGGDVAAMRHLAVRYRLGLGARRDEGLAAAWLRRAALGGDREAQVGLATSYQLGDHVPQNLAEARRWYERAAHGGHLGAMLALAFLHQGGEGHPRNPAQALRWYRLAAEGGSPAAQFHMGLLREGAAGEPPQPVEAYAWYLLAAEQRHALAVSGAAALRPRLRPEQARAAQAWVRTWKERHGRPAAVHRLTVDPPVAPVV